TCGTSQISAPGGVDGDACGFVGTRTADVRRVLESCPCRIQLEYKDVIRVHRPQLGLKCVRKWGIDRSRPTRNVGCAVGIDGNAKRVVIADAADICGINEPTFCADFCDKTIGKSAGEGSLKRISGAKVTRRGYSCNIRIVGC